MPGFPFGTRMKYIIVDLDGTLANVDHRLNLVKRKKKWFEKFYELAWKDKPNQWCVELINSMLAAGYKVKIVSARPKEYEEKTIDWLIKSGVNCTLDNLTLHLLRGNKDYTKDVDLKRKWLKDQIYGPDPSKQDILFVVDDRKRVVDMWREEGLTCLQCYEWEEYAGRAN